MIDKPALDALRQQLDDEKDHARVVGVPGSAHGDLPRLARG